MTPNPTDLPVYGAIEGGGTKFVCAVGSSPAHILDAITIPTRTVDQTLGEVVAFFMGWRERGVQLAGFGVSCFGPLSRDPASADYGRLRNSPKTGWETADIGGYLSDHIRVPLKIDTDVNGAALAERLWGAAQGLSHFAYVTVGTGIGVGIVRNGELLNGVAHPELGHYRPPRHRDDPPSSFKGICPFHDDCLEGLVSGPALHRRLQGMPAEDVPDDHPIWTIVADGLAHLCTVLFLTCAMERIVFGGGVMQQPVLIGMIQAATREKLGGYLTHPLHAGSFNDVIVTSQFLKSSVEGRPISAGVLGGFIFAAEAVADSAYWMRERTI